jgi:AbrB family looped-hinge helix DNA binding protein
MPDFPTRRLCSEAAEQAVIEITAHCAKALPYFWNMSYCKEYDSIIDLCQSNGGMTVSTETRLRVSENGRVVIPAEFRKALGINPGDEVIARVEENELRITTVKARIDRAQQLVRQYIKPGRALADELIAERRREARNE